MFSQKPAKLIKRNEINKLISQRKSETEMNEELINKTKEALQLATDRLAESENQFQIFYYGLMELMYNNQDLLRGDNYRCLNHVLANVVSCYNSVCNDMSLVVEEINKVLEDLKSKR